MSPHLAVEYWLSETMSSSIIIILYPSKLNITVRIIHTLVVCSVTLSKARKNTFNIQSEMLTRKLYKPKYQMRASLCHVIKREHTNIKHLS